MSEPVYNPERPPWDTQIPGKHPALTAEVTEEEITQARKFRDEAVSMAGAHSRPMAGPLQTFLADAIDREHHHRINLKVAIEHRLGPAVIRQHSRAMILNMIYLGRFDAALAEALLPSGRPRPGFRYLVDLARLYKEADARPDDEECQCKRRRAMIPDLARAGEPEVEIELKRRSMVGWFYSEKRDRVVECWQCSICHHANAHNNGPPANQAHIHQLRTTLEKASPKELHERLPSQLSDVALFKPGG